MAGAILTTAITADITDLQTKLAAARSSYNAAAADMAKFANEARKAGQDLTASMNPAVQKSAAAMAAGKVQVTQLANELKAKLVPALEDAAKGHKNLQGFVGQNRVAVNELTHTVRAVADGLAAGINPMTLFSEEFFRVSQAMTEFNTISTATLVRFGLIGAAAVAAGGALFELAEHFSRMRAEADLANSERGLGINISVDDVHAISTSLREAGHSISEFSDLNAEARNKVIRDFGEIRQGSAAMTRALAEIAPDFAHAFGLSATESVKVLVDSMNDLSGAGGKVMQSLHLSDAELADFQRLASENPKQGMVLFLDTLKDRLDKVTQSEDNVHQSTWSLMSLMDDAGKSLGNALGGPALDLGGIANPATTRLEDTIERNKQAGADLNAALAKVPNNLAPDEGAIQKTLETMALDISKTHDQIAAEQAQYVKKILDSDRMGGEQRVHLTDQYGRLLHDVAVQSSDETAKDLEIKARQAASAAGAARKDEVEAELGVLREGLNNTKLTADAKKDIHEQIAQLEIRDVRASAAEAKKTTEEQWQDYSATMRNAIADAKGDYKQQMDLVTAWVAHGKEMFPQHLHAYEDAIQEESRLTQEHTALMRTQLEQQGRAAEALAQAQANLAKIGAKAGTGEFKPSLSLVFDPGQLTTEVNAQVAQLKAALDAQLKGVKAKVQLDLEAGNTAGADETYAKATQDLLNYTNAVQQLNQKAAQAVQQSWEKITGPIGNAMDQAFDAVVRGGRNTGVQLEHAAEGIVESWAKSGLKVVTNWAADEIKKLVLTETGVAARSAAEETGLLAQIAKTLGLTASGDAVKAASNATQITGDAAVAAAGAYAATAAIPVVGPELAPGAAAEAYGAVMSFNVASAEGGMERTHAGPMIVHEDEMVLPAHLADAVRSMANNGLNTPRAARMSPGGTSSTVNNSGDTSHTININQTNNVRGGSGSGADVANAISKGNSDLHSTLSAWYGGHSVSLPGRRTWR